MSPLLMLEDPTGEWQDWQDEPVSFGPNISLQLGIQSLTYSPDGREILVRDSFDVIALDAQTGEQIAKFQSLGMYNSPYQPPPGDLSLDPDGTRFATIDDEQVHLWDMTTGDAQLVIGEARLLIERPKGSIGAASFSPDWSRMAVVNLETSNLELVDVESGELVGLITNHRYFPASNLEYTPDGDYLTASTAWSIDQVWQIHDLHLMPRDKPNRDSVSLTVVQPAFIEPSDRILIEPGSGNLAVFTDDQVQLIDPDSMEVVDSWMLPVEEASEIAYSTIYSPDGRWLAFTKPPRRVVTLIDLSIPDRTVYEFGIEQGKVMSLAFSADGSMLAVATGPRPSEVSGDKVDIYAAGTWERVHRITVGSEMSIAFNPVKPHQLATTTRDGHFSLWDASSGELIRTIAQDIRISSYAYTPDGSMLAADVTFFEEGSATPRRRLRFYSEANGELIASFDIDSETWSVAFSPDGTQLALGMSVGTIELWGVNE